MKGRITLVDKMEPEIMTKQKKIQKLIPNIEKLKTQINSEKVDQAVDLIKRYGNSQETSVQLLKGSQILMKEIVDFRMELERKNNKIKEKQANFYQKVSAMNLREKDLKAQESLLDKRLKEIRELEQELSGKTRTGRLSVLNKRIRASVKTVNQSREEIQLKLGMEYEKMKKLSKRIINKIGPYAFPIKDPALLEDLITRSVREIVLLEEESKDRMTEKHEDIIKVILGLYEILLHKINESSKELIVKGNDPTELNRLRTILNLSIPKLASLEKEKYEYTERDKLDQLFNKDLLKDDKAEFIAKHFKKEYLLKFPTGLKNELFQILFNDTLLPSDLVTLTLKKWENLGESGARERRQFVASLPELLTLREKFNIAKDQINEINRMKGG